MRAADPASGFRLACRYFASKEVQGIHIFSNLIFMTLTPDEWLRRAAAEGIF